MIVFKNEKQERRLLNSIFLVKPVNFLMIDSSMKGGELIVPEKFVCQNQKVSLLFAISTFPPFYYWDADEQNRCH